jgi:hypothetical protein
VSELIRKKWPSAGNTWDGTTRLPGQYPSGAKYDAAC